MPWWAVFLAGYLAGIVGTIGALYAGYLLAAADDPQSRKARLLAAKSEHSEQRG